MSLLQRTHKTNEYALTFCETISNGMINTTVPFLITEESFEFSCVTLNQGYCTHNGA